MDPKVQERMSRYITTYSGMKGNYYHTPFKQLLILLFNAPPSDIRMVRTYKGIRYEYFEPINAFGVGGE